MIFLVSQSPSKIKKTFRIWCLKKNNEILVFVLLFYCIEIIVYVVLKLLGKQEEHPHQLL